MKCEKCGMLLPDDSEFCQYCGAKIEQMVSMPSPPAGNELPSVLSFLANNAVDNINANSRITEKHISDSDYGLVPEKPIFTLFVDGAEEYLNGLVSEDNEELTWNRKGSMPVTGVSGPVDIYTSRKKNGQQYKTLYVSIYGKANSTTIPKGFARKGAVKKIQADNASETGAGRNSTAEASIDLRNKTFSESSSTTTFKTETPVQPKRQEMLFEDAPNLIQENIPVLLEKVSLYHDPQVGNLAAKCTFRSLTEKSMLAMMIDVHCTDVWGTPTDSVEGFQYLDLRTTQGMVFGQDKEIPIPNPATRFVEIEIKKVIFADRSLAEAGHDKAVLPDQQSLLSFFGSEALTNEYVRETGINAQNTITEGGGYWRCTCGAINSDSDDNCYHCNASKSNLLALQNVDLISANLEAYQKEAQAKADRERTEREAFRRQAEEKARLEREEIERKNREAAARQAEEMRIKKEQHQKKVKRISIIAATVLLSLLAVYAVIWHIIPSIRYNDADTALKNQQYDDAYSKFLAINSYKDSAEKAKEALYQKGCSLMNSGSYAEAAEEFSKVSDYKDSHEQATFCRNQEAYIEATELFEGGKYTEAAEAFAQLGDFSDSAEQVNAANYQYAKQLLENGLFEEAHAAFEALADYKDSGILSKESYYQLASKYYDEKEYEKAYDTFGIISHNNYKDSTDLRDESCYQLATDLLAKGKYSEAASYFSKIPTYKDSLNLSKEAKYCEATDYIDKKAYGKAIDILYSIKGYKDSADLLKKAQYNNAKQLAEKGSYTEAIALFKSLGDYSDSATKYKETKYAYGNSKLKAKDYYNAVQIFEDLGSYKDCKDKVKEAKYGYVLANKNNTNTTTYAYLKDLKSAGYKDSKSIYNSLYAWKIINIYFNSSENGTTKMYNISKYDPVYCHFEVSGGPPGETTYIYHTVTMPDGSTKAKKRPEYKQWRGDKSWWGWEDGLYTTPYYGATGTLTLKFYDEEGNLIGEGSVAITN